MPSLQRAGSSLHSSLSGDRGVVSWEVKGRRWQEWEREEGGSYCRLRLISACAYHPSNLVTKVAHIRMGILALLGPDTAYKLMARLGPVIVRRAVFTHALSTL